MNLIYEKQSDKSQEETIESLKTELSKVGFGVLWELNFRNKLKEKGIDYPYDFWVFEVCNPSLAAKVLSQNHRAGYLLPCKMSVHEDENGIHVGLAKPSELIGMLDDSKVLKELASEVETTLKNVIDHIV